MPALKVSSEQRAELRSQAHALKPVVIVGAEGLTDAVLTEIKVHLKAHQLIKIRVFGDEREERIAIYEDICDRLNAAPIQHIGKLLVIWKPEKVAAERAPAARAPAAKTKRGALPSAREVAGESPSNKGRAPRVVKVVKPSENPMRKPKAQKLVVRGNERVTAGGNIKKAKKRQTSAKRLHQTSK
ncbi:MULTISPECIES: YhbY family RNA-binding protein [Paraburkholderia]|jgi:putative YhbY family RNA-binding protein|uniref:RNA-binding protein n=1 Tax=Paraburkholderia caribensis TaxID=75105 RepID=A0A9Q6WKH9_9BURK|nr:MULTISPECIES: YhbY family RNA-binding protein [Paraburkholderia]ALP63491.1 RNA-binding protein [Paraburkholderia caribensis]AMV42042.1 RNA-binding protein [Paraburkholderia caribensis]AUT51258.1 RNA-binding protein [Paraburkholderia caribensis]MCO4877975.1 YhbY family RNA-binding protein [Paraburkholderia caribensis]MDR6381434.1 putative YhbY family RNA-binding protein [Paraburkholderia caribensis]